MNKRCIEVVFVLPESRVTFVMEPSEDTDEATDRLLSWMFRRDCLATLTKRADEELAKKSGEGLQ